MIGTFDAYMALATTSSLNAQSSSNDPPPLATIKRSKSISFMSLIAFSISEAARSPWTWTGAMTICRFENLRKITCKISLIAAPVGEVTTPIF